MIVSLYISVMVDAKIDAKKIELTIDDAFLVDAARRDPKSVLDLVSLRLSEAEGFSVG